MTIAYNGENSPYGWLSNLAPHYPVRSAYGFHPSAEALFQFLRFEGNAKIQEAIRASASPIRARKQAIANAKHLKVVICDAADIARMRFCFVVKLQSNRQLIGPLLETRTAAIVEEVTTVHREVEIDGKSYAGGKPFWGANPEGGGENTTGKLWMEIRDELLANGVVAAVSPKGDKISLKAEGPLGPGGFAKQPLTKTGELSPAESRRLKDCEDRIAKGRKEVEKGFVQMVEAMHEVYERRLYRANGRTFEAYFQQRWHYQRAHAYRLRHCGRLLRLMKKEVAANLNSQAHFRPLLELQDDTLIREALLKIDAWQRQDADMVISPHVVASAVELMKPPSNRPLRISDNLSVTQVMNLLTEAQSEVELKPSAGKQILVNLQKNIESLSRKRSTGIAWTDSTWNTLQGCKAVSAGCQHCYAAKLLATRMQSKFPGIAERVEIPAKGSAPFEFTGKVELLVRSLSIPLREKRPRRYFVNSLSDLFYKEVPDWFINEVFDVMQKADWHQFQVLTKRPERMASYTKNRFPNGVAPQNIWMGCSIENQREHDRRMPHLNQVVTAIRWVSAEPLLGPVKFDLSKVDWVVVGGESNGGRKMEKAWALDILSQCEKSDTAYFFKQWGDYGENGEKARRTHGKGHETLNGRIYHKYPA